MSLLSTRWRKMGVLVAVAVLLFYFSTSSLTGPPTFDRFEGGGPAPDVIPPISNVQKPLCSSQKDGRTQDGKFHWGCLTPRYTVWNLKSLPTGTFQSNIPTIQATPRPETPADREIRLQRREAVKGNFTHAWKGYKEHAWLHDEVRPQTGSAFDPFGGWAATLVDALDTLWILGFKQDFEEAVTALDQIDFTTCSLEEINVFETTIRYLGGFLAAYDISDGRYPQLLQKAYDIGEMLIHAFDTPNRIPITRWHFKKAASGAAQEASENVLSAEIGSLTLEFTRLSQLTGDMRFYDAVQRVMDVFDVQQLTTFIPGLWPVILNGKGGRFNEHGVFKIDGMVDSLYEYLPKQHLLLGGAVSQYYYMYQRALDAMKQSIFFRPLVPGYDVVLFPGSVETNGSVPLDELVIKPRVEHLGCFSGGMVAVAAKIFNNEAEMATAHKLVEGCLLAYENGPKGIMPEVMSMVACRPSEPCKWDERRWEEAVVEAHGGEGEADEIIRKEYLPEGVARVDDTKYHLRPEAIESVFILYRITGDEALRERAWKMFNSIVAPTITNVAHAALDNCMTPDAPKADRMESFWLAETLKYFYLIFSEPDVISLDEYVLNTEAHPLRRPVKSGNLYEN